MKFSTTSAVAIGLVGTAAADSWGSAPASSSSSSSSASTTSASTTVTKAWSTSSSSSLPATTVTCPATVTKVETCTETKYAATSEVYQSTVTLPAPGDATVTVYPGQSTTAAWGDWAEWSSASSSASSVVAPVTSVPAGCTAATTATSTTTTTVTKDGTTTLYKSTLFVGPGIGGKTITVTGTGTGSPAGPTGSWSTGGSTNSVANGGNGGSGNGKGGLKPGVSSASVIATGADVFTWTVPVATETVSWTAPAYTQAPDGSWSGSGNSSSGSSGSGSGSVPKPGSAASNVTAPFEPVKESGCNSASDRSTWCGGKSIDSDYYQDYFSGKVCSYDLTITNGTFNHEGVDRLSFLINGQMPGPVIECNWGDKVVINVHNNLENNGTSIHWHGIRQMGTNDQDGVPGVSECAIAPGTSRTYTWHASSYGTTWYHSHWGTQYGDGIRGPIIIHGPATANYDIDAGTVMIDDLFPGTSAAQADVIAHTGPQGTDNYLLNGHNVKADLSSGQHSLWNVQAGKTYRFRFINSASQNMWSLHIDSHKFTVIAADLVPVTPYETEWLNIGIGQRYDVIVKMNQKVDSYFLRAVTQTGCPSTCTNTGLSTANGIIAYEGVPTSPYQLPTSTAGSVTAADFAICVDEPIASLVPHLVKPAGTSDAFTASASTLPAGNVGTINTADDGTVFQWFLNNGAINVDYTQPTLKTLAQGGSANSSLISNPIVLQQKNQWVYFVIQNQFFASHPIHLHGHDLSLLGQGAGIFTPDMVSTLNFKNPVRRDTAMLEGSAGPGNPAGYTVIGFETDNPGAWLMHCHIVWHVDGGLALQWIEAPEEIHAQQYTNTAQFQNECSAYEAYEAKSPSGKKFTGQSGLKARGLFFDQELARANANQFKHVVRRGDTAEKRYIDNMNIKRGLGDGFKPRHGGRR